MPLNMEVVIGFVGKDFRTDFASIDLNNDSKNVVNTQFLSVTEFAFTDRVGMLIFPVKTQFLNRRKSHGASRTRQSWDFTSVFRAMQHHEEFKPKSHGAKVALESLWRIRGSR